jgi:hypothetical protein
MESTIYTDTSIQVIRMQLFYIESLLNVQADKQAIHDLRLNMKNFRGISRLEIDDITILISRNKSGTFNLQWWR